MSSIKCPKEEHFADPVAGSSPAGVPLLDELRTYFYEHQIEEMPSALASDDTEWALVRGSR